MYLLTVARKASLETGFFFYSAFCELIKLTMRDNYGSITRFLHLYMGIFASDYFNPTVRR